MLYVTKDINTNKILCYGYNPRNRNRNNNNSNNNDINKEIIDNNDIILEITEDQWEQSKYGKYADIVDNEFIIKEITNNDDADSVLHNIRKYFIIDPTKQINNINGIANPYTAPSDGVVDCQAWNNGGWSDMEILVNGKSYYKNYSGGNYGDEDEHKHTRVPVHKGDIVQMIAQNCRGCNFHFLPYKYN